MVFSAWIAPASQGEFDYIQVITLTYLPITSICRLLTLELSWKEFKSHVSLTTCFKNTQHYIWHTAYHHENIIMYFFIDLSVRTVATLFGLRSNYAMVNNHTVRFYLAAVNMKKCTEKDKSRENVRILSGSLILKVRSDIRFPHLSAELDTCRLATAGATYGDS